ncbi:BspA family leucine-rich repeat surface protein [Gracilimonas sp.]|uniref:BspA family leucine-rich repeat surface protein n=1 Tax=Gracilimonas sp. TaxID=1974203 RepID=UPI003BAD36CF
MKTFITLVLKSLFFLLIIGVNPAMAQFGPPPSGPIADFVEISGTLEVGETLTGSYEYNDPDGFPEDGSTYQWYRADDEFGSGWSAISGATDTTYTLVAADDGKYISFEVTPSNGTETGMPAESMLEGPVGSSSGGGGNTAPVVSNVSFSGTLEVGSILTGSYDYTDADSDPESGSVYTWSRSDDGAGSGKTPIPTADAATYTLTSADEGKYISFSVIPSDGTDAGTQEESTIQGPVQAETTTPAISFAGGTGSEADPYQVATLEQLQALKDGPSLHFVLNNDLDASTTATWNSGEGFVPIGGDSPFTGSFNGQGFVITGLTISRSTEDYVGLFAVIGDNGSVKDIGLEQLTITGGGNTGGLAGENNGSISGSYADGDVDGSAIVGGLVGLNNATISESYSAGTVDGTQDIGGLVGLHSLGTISKSYSTSDATGTANNVGGLIGFSYDNVENSYATGSANGDTNIGGLVGNYNSGTVSNSYSTGSVTGSSNVGGFIGQKNSFAAASNSFWDTQTSGQGAATGIGSTTGITGQTTTEMQTQSTFTDAGWDFTDIWAMSGYPSLRTFVGNTAPGVSSAIANFSVNEDAADSTLDLTSVFSDAEQTSGELTFSVVSNSNAALVTATVDNTTDLLTLSYQPDSSGTADIIIQAEDNGGLTVQDSFTITINAVNDVPVLVSAIADITVNEEGAISDIDLTAVFSDVEQPAADLSYFVVSNTNSDLVNLAIDQNTNLLSFTLSPDTYGEAEVVVGAVDEEFSSVSDTLNITVNPVALQITLLSDRADTLTVYSGFSDTLRFNIHDANGNAVTTDTDLNLTGSVSNTVDLVSSNDPVYDTEKEHWFIDFVSEDNYSTLGSMSLSVEYTNHADLGDEQTVILDPRGNRPFITTWDVSGDNMSVTFPTADQVDGKDLSDYDFRIDWGNGESEWISGAEPTVTKTYTAEATKTVKISGNFPYLSGTKILFGTNEITGNMESIIQWGDIEWESMKNSFTSITNLTLSASDVPDLSQVTSLEGMFSISGITTPDISGWDVSGITNMEQMFLFAVNFNSDISSWNVGNVQNMNGMFAYSQAFNRDIGDWNVASVDSMFGMFTNASAFDQNLADWDISQVVSFDDESQGAGFMNGTALSTANYDSLLVGWGVQNVQPDITISFGETKYTLKGLSGHDQLTNTGWTINDGGLEGNPFITTWRTTSANETVTIPTGGGANIPDYDFQISWGDGTIEMVTGDDPDPSHTYTVPGDHKITIISSTFYLNPQQDGDLDQLISLDQWGAVEWQNMTNSFAWARNMEYNATDAPDLSVVTSTAGMFFAAEKVNGDLSRWNTSTITDMSFMFDGAKIFNGDITTWDVSKVTNMREMFQNADSVNQDLSNWNVSSVTNMQGLFQNAPSFNGDVSTWNTGAVTNMFGVFAGASSFNQDISGWDVSSVTDFGGMFLDAEAFDQNLGDWSVEKATRFDNNSFGFLAGSNLSQNNYDSLLIGWSELTFVNSNLTLNVGGVNYTVFGSQPKQDLLDKGFTISDGGFSLGELLLEASKTNPGIADDSLALSLTINEIPVPLDIVSVTWAAVDTASDQALEGFKTPLYRVADGYWNLDLEPIKQAYPTGIDFTITTALSIPSIDESYIRTVDVTMNLPLFYIAENGVTIKAPYAAVGDTATLEINGKKILFTKRDRADLDSLLNVDPNHSGLATAVTSGITDMSYLFSNNADFNQPIGHWDVSSVVDMQRMFGSAAYFNQPIEYWDVSSVTDMSKMFQFTNAFNQAIGGWDVSNVTNMESMFFSNGVFNKPIGDWDTGKVTDMSAMFSGALSFNQPIGNWDVSSVTNMSYLFASNGPTAHPFNHSLEKWDVSSVTDMRYMFFGSAFNQSIGNWDVSSVTDMSMMFGNADAFNQDIGDWNVSHVTDMSGMFTSTAVFNQPIGGWDVSNVTTMADMFYGNRVFNQEIGNWNVSKVTNMENMFFGAISFNKPINGWDVSAVTNMYSMFAATRRVNIRFTATKFNQPLDKWDVSKVTNMAFMFASSRFNQNLNSWNMESVTNTNAMFVNAYYFNNGFKPQQKNKTLDGVEVLSSLDWNVANVSNMASMFQGAESFNQDISSWDVSNVKYFDAAPNEDAENAEGSQNTLAKTRSSKESTEHGSTEVDPASGKFANGRSVNGKPSAISPANSESQTLTQNNVTATQPDSIAGFLVGSGLNSENASKMFVEWSKRDLQDGVSINIGAIELDEAGANAMKTLREANNMTVAWGGQQGVDDEPQFEDLPSPYEIRTEDTRILKLWDYVSDVATPDNQLKFKFDIISDSVETVSYDNTNGELAITARADADTFFVAIQVSNTDGITSLDTMEVRTDPNFITSAEMMAALPDEFELNQNYPNPFNPTTVIRYGVPQSSEVRLEVFDMLGRKVATLVNGERQRAGWHQVNFDASRLASGMYLYRIVAGKYVQTKKMMLIK